jgi:hypothetical protein
MGGKRELHAAQSKLGNAQGWHFLYCSATFLKVTSVGFDCLNAVDRLMQVPSHCWKRKTLLSWAHVKSQDASYVTRFMFDTV